MRRRMIGHEGPRWGLVTCILLLTAWACSSGGGSGPDEGPKYLWPLAVGNTWTWREATAGDFTGTVVGTAMVKDTTVYKVAFTGADDASLLFNREDGLWTYGTESVVLNTPLLLFKYPTSVGESWTILGQRVSVVSLSERVTVPAGTFDCVVYDLSGNRAYFAPGVGFVRGRDVVNGTADAELLSYSLN